MLSIPSTTTQKINNNNAVYQINLYVYILIDSDHHLASTIKLEDNEYI